MAQGPSLNSVLDSIPPENRKRLDEKLTDRRSRARIARSLGRKWRVIADFVPNVHKNDIESIAYDHQNDLQMQQRALLDMWVERNGHLATYHQLAKSLWAADAINSLHVLCMELGAPEQPTPMVHAPPTPPSQTPPQATSPPSQPTHFPQPQSQPHSPPQPTSHHWDTPPPSPLPSPPQLQRGTLHSPPHDITQATPGESFPKAFSHSLPSQAVDLPEPDLKHLMRLVKTDKAYKLGIQLGVDEHSLKIAQRNHLNDHAALLMEVLDLYLKQIVPASWVDVATALDVIGERKNANDIAKEFGFSIPGVVDSNTYTVHAPLPPFGRHKQSVNTHPHHTLPCSNPEETSNTGVRSRGIRAIIEPSSDREPNPVPLPQNSKGPTGVGFSRMWCWGPMVLLCASAILLGLGIQYANSVMPYNNDSKLQGDKWRNQEPLMKLLFHIGYTDSSGKDASFRLIDEIQMHCSRLGTQLGIDTQTLKSFESGRRPAVDVCRDVLDEWKMRGTETSHPVTWAGLLKAMKNFPQLNRAANLLENALKLHFKEEH